MSEQDKADAARGWRYVEKLLAEEPDDGAPEGAFGADELMAAAEAKLAQRKARAPSAPPEPSPPPPPPAIASVVAVRNRWTPSLAIAGALAAGVFLYLIIQPPERVGSGRPSNHRIAERARDEAEASCAARQWDACERSLDRARELDPAGDEEPRVMNARAAIAAGRATTGGDGG